MQSWLQNPMVVDSPFLLTEEKYKYYSHSNSIVITLSKDICEYSNGLKKNTLSNRNDFPFQSKNISNASLLFLSLSCRQQTFWERIITLNYSLQEIIWWHTSVPYMQDELYVNMRLTRVLNATYLCQHGYDNFKSHVNIVILHVDINMLHVDINESHAC